MGRPWRTPKYSFVSCSEVGDSFSVPVTGGVEGIKQARARVHGAAREWRGRSGLDWKFTTRPKLRALLITRSK